MSSIRLPKNWQEYKTDDGESYYYNFLTNKTQWEFPDESINSDTNNIKILENDDSMKYLDNIFNPASVMNDSYDTKYQLIDNSNKNDFSDNQYYEKISSSKNPRNSSLNHAKKKNNYSIDDYIPRENQKILFFENEGSYEKSNRNSICGNHIGVESNNTLKYYADHNENLNNINSNYNTRDDNSIQINSNKHDMILFYCLNLSYIQEGFDITTNDIVRRLIFTLCSIKYLINFIYFNFIEFVKIILSSRFNYISKNRSNDQNHDKKKTYSTTTLYEILNIFNYNADLMPSTSISSSPFPSSFSKFPFSGSLDVVGNVDKEVLMSIRKNPDFYSPFWIATSCIILLFLGSNIIFFFSNHGNDNTVKVNYATILVSAILLYSYLFIFPLCLKLFTFFFITRDPSKTNAVRLDELFTFKYIFCVYGYSLLPLFFASFARLICNMLPQNLIFTLVDYILTLILGIISLYFLQITLSSYIYSSKTVSKNDFSLKIYFLVVTTSAQLFLFLFVRNYFVLSRENN